ncbi:matrixin family metalloprotease [bacterium]|nr:matrixin family metalloprotease [bacterium]
MKKLLLFIFAIFMMFISPVKAEYYGPVWNSGVIKVYIPNDNYTEMMKEAFQKWESNINKQIVFQYVTDKEEADIDVDFVEKVDGSDGEIGSYNTTVQGGAIVHGQIFIATKGNQRYSQDLIYTTMLHEIGHILGLPGTNRNIGIMHEPISETQDIVKNDIVRLYKFYKWSIINNGNAINKLPTVNLR